MPRRLHAKKQDLTALQKYVNPHDSAVNTLSEHRDDLHNAVKVQQQQQAKLRQKVGDTGMLAIACIIFCS